MLTGPLSPSFLGPYCLSGVRSSASSSILLSYGPFVSSFVHFNNGPKYLIRGNVQVFILSMKFLQQSLVSICFPVHLRYSFLVFFFNLRLFDGVRFQYYRVLCKFPFLQVFWCFFWFAPSIPSTVCRFPLFIMSMTHFLKTNSIPISWLYILIVSIRL